MTMHDERQKRYQRHKLEENYVTARIDGANMSQAAEIAGGNARDIRSPGKRIETPAMRERMRQALENKRVTLDSIAQRVADGMESNVVGVSDGVAIQSKIADQALRHKWTSTAAQLMGVMDDPKGKTGGSSVTVTLSGPVAERYMEFLEGEDGDFIEGE